MRKLDTRIKVGTIVKMPEGFFPVTEINETRVNFKVKGLMGSFQSGHIISFSNSVIKK